MQSKISSQWFYELSEQHPLTYRSDRSKTSGSQLLTESVDIWKRFIQSEMSECEAITILRAKLTGDYLMRDSDIVVSIKEKSDYLTITNLLHALEAESLMILYNSNRFFIRGHDVSLQFDKFRQGVAEVMKVSSSWSKLDGCVFERITL